MVAAKCERLLVHPIVTGLLNYKWKRFGRYVYYITLFLYAAFVVLLNVYMMIIPPFYRVDWVKTIEYREYIKDGMPSPDYDFSDTNNDSSCFFYRDNLIEENEDLAGCQIIDTPTLNLRYVIFAFSIFNLLREVFQMIGQKLNYIDVTNMIEVALYILSLLVSINFDHYTVEQGFRALINDSSVGDYNLSSLDSIQWDTGLRQEWQQEIGAFAVFFSWMVLLLFIQKIPRLGIFVVMFTDVMWTFAQFLFVFIFFIFGFAFSFSILMGNQLVFANWYESLITVTVMTIGELDYTSKFFSSGDYQELLYTKECSFVLFSIFLIMMTIIIMNLLVGLAVGDIIQVQEHATLERLGMQVDSSLEVEFGIPAFIRKKFSLRRQKIEINKYRKANFFKKLFYRDNDMTFEKLSKAVESEDTADRDESISTTDRILSNITTLKGRITDLLNDQAEMKLGLRGVRSLVRDVRREAKNHVDELKEDLSSTGVNIHERIDSTRVGLSEKTENESSEIRGRVDSTRGIIDALKEDVDITKEKIELIRSQFEERMDRMQEALISKNWGELEAGLARCDQKIEDTKDKILESLEEMKIVLVKEKFMTNV